MRYLDLHRERQDVLGVLRQFPSCLDRDSFREDDEKVKRRLKSYDIPYVMFDLDQDSYTDFFGWEREMDRKYSHRGKTWEGERYEKVVEIAKEYIHLHSF